MQFFSMKLCLSSWCSNILFSIHVFLILCTTKAIVKLPGNETVPAVIVFGDSIVDPGNNNNLNTLIKCNFPPYGRDFPGGIATGRFSNGKIPSDLIVEELGIKDLLPAYLDPTLQPNDLLTGVSFASSASGYDPLTPKIVSALSLTDQLDYFREYIGKLRGIVGEEKTNFTLAKSLFVVVAGSDDIVNTYFVTRARKLQYDVSSYTHLMVNFASTFLKELFELGARRLAVFSAPPLGCLPSQRTLAGGLQRECAENYNQAAQLYNAKLSSELDSLNSKLPQAKIVYVDVYSPLIDLIQNPGKYGFEVADKGCCGTGTIEVAVLCNQYNLVTCTNVSGYVFWDSYHPTERAYAVLISHLIQKYINSFI
ncbi:hypothetical protein L1049_025683 [Liquidambar formosana]|uniref:GDSL esterase/lipase EXL3 n=1 Tax=Liquidambar formosana TaxID=63359 RepID=A0AAP0NFI8_LIQFO